MAADYAELSHILGLPAEAARPLVTGIAFDSRNVAQGNMFFALTGSKADGASFIPKAVEAGASVVIGEGARPVSLPEAVIYGRVPDARHALAKAAAWFYPRQPGTIIAVTGTAGKSSVADFTRQIFQHLGKEAASLGTLGVITSKGADYGSLTTPDPVTLHQTLDRLAGDGVTHLIIEASSHGLDQRRLDGIRFTAGAFTNLGRDHLDYHASVDEYFACKMRLFTELLPKDAWVVINTDGDRAEEVAEMCLEHGLKFAETGTSGATLRNTKITNEAFGQKLTLENTRNRYEVFLPLIGAFQVENALLAAGIVLTLGGPTRFVLEALGKLKGVPGRLERVGSKGTAPVFVDYAHKPEALAAVLDTMRAATKGRLIVVFGCGGDRDKGKRPIMGAIAAEKADIVIVTDDNPRSEVAEAIRSEILMAAPGALEIGNRGHAIRRGVALLQDGDALIIAGKGHETGQIVGRDTIPFSDHDEAREALKSCGGTIL